MAELENGMLLVQVTRADGLQYSGVLASDNSALLDITSLSAPPLLPTVDTAVESASASPSLTSSSDVVSVRSKRSYVKSGIYSKKNKVPLLVDVE